MHRVETQLFRQHLRTLENDEFSTLRLVSDMLGSSSRMAFERPLLVGESTAVVSFRSVAVSANLFVVLSSNLVIFSKERLLKRSFSFKPSSLQDE